MFRWLCEVVVRRIAGLSSKAWLAHLLNAARGMTFAFKETNKVAARKLNYRVCNDAQHFRPFDLLAARDRQPGAISM